MGAAGKMCQSNELGTVVPVLAAWNSMNDFCELFGQLMETTGVCSQIQSVFLLLLIVYETSYLDCLN